MKLFRLCFTNGRCTDWHLLHTFDIKCMTLYSKYMCELLNCYNYYIEYKEI